MRLVLSDTCCDYILVKETSGKIMHLSSYVLAIIFKVRTPNHERYGFIFTLFSLYFHFISTFFSLILYLFFMFFQN